MQKTLLVPLDGSEFSEASLPWAATLARAGDASLTLARVVEYPTMHSDGWLGGGVSIGLYEELFEREQEVAAAYLTAVRERLADTRLHVETLVLTGNPSVALLDLADELGATAIVMASHGNSGLKRFVLGSVAMQLVSHSAVPVFLVRAAVPEHRREPGLSRLLVPLDGSALAARAIELAREIAEPDSTLVLVRVVPRTGGADRDEPSERSSQDETADLDATEAKAYLERIAEPLRAAGLSVKTETTVGESKSTVSRQIVLIAASWDADAIVMSTHGRSGVTGWLLGSVADEVVRNADRPVLLVSARALALRSTGQRRVGDVMTTDVMAVRDDEPLATVLRKLVRRQASGAPVLDADGRIVGVISQRDLVSWQARTVEAMADQFMPSEAEYLRHLRSDTVRTVMSSPATTVPESASLETALALLRERGIHRLPVTRDGRLVGILTGSDVLLAMLSQLEAQEGTEQPTEG